MVAKVARWDPDKRWLTAVDAVGELKTRGLRPLLIARGGIEDHGREVVARARLVGLAATSVTWGDSSPAALWRAIATAQPSDVVLLESALSRPQLQCLYRASDGVLANSGIEPFGLVGLEAMACGGVSFLGATGEDYATRVTMRSRCRPAARASWSHICSTCETPALCDALTAPGAQNGNSIHLGPRSSFPKSPSCA